VLYWEKYISQFLNNKSPQSLQENLVYWFYKEAIHHVHLNSNVRFGNFQIYVWILSQCRERSRKQTKEMIKDLKAISLSIQT
jgi:hypothetical protein